MMFSGFSAEGARGGGEWGGERWEKKKGKKRGGGREGEGERKAYGFLHLKIPVFIINVSSRHFSQLTV